MGFYIGDFTRTLMRDALGARPAKVRKSAPKKAEHPFQAPVLRMASESLQLSRPANRAHEILKTGLG